MGMHIMCHSALLNSLRTSVTPMLWKSSSSSRNSVDGHRFAAEIGHKILRSHASEHNTRAEPFVSWLTLFKSDVASGLKFSHEPMDILL